MRRGVLASSGGWVTRNEVVCVHQENSRPPDWLEPVTPVILACQHIGWICDNMSESSTHQENMRVIFGRLWDLWKDLKTSKTLRWRVFRETGTYSSRDKVVFERLLRIFQRQAGSFAKTIFSFASHLLQVFDGAYMLQML